MASAQSPAPAPAEEAAPELEVENIYNTLTELCADEDSYSWDPPRRYLSHVKRLQLLAAQLPRADLASPAARTALRGISGDLDRARVPLAAYRVRSRIFILIHCRPLCDSLRSSAASIARWLALLDSLLLPLPDLRKRTADLSRDLLRSDLRVTNNEERVYHTLRKEAAAVRPSSKAVQSGIVMDVAHALGADPADHAKLAEQILLLRADLAASCSPAQRRILVFLEKIFDNWSSTYPAAAVGSANPDFEEGAHIPPFKNFLCPLTKEVMKDPVVLESSQNYERTAIMHWFDRCLEDGRNPTCPVTGQVLRTLELKPNIGLAGAIEEWVNRNVEEQIDSAVQCFEDVASFPTETVEKVLDNVYKISEEHPSSRYKVRNAGLIGHIISLLKEQSKMLRPQLRIKALVILHSMAKDEESKFIMLEEGACRLAIRSLTGSSEIERESSLRLLLAFSCDYSCCKKLATEKGALVLLSSMHGDSDHPTLSNLAEEILNNMEIVDENIKPLAVVGRLQPLVTRLCEGTEDIRIGMANLVGELPLTDSGKDYIARKGGKVLVDLLSFNLEGRISSLQALYNISTLDDNATILVNFGVLPSLTTILFAAEEDDSLSTKDLSAMIIANIVLNSGHWELSIVDNEGHSMQSEVMIHKILRLLSHSSFNCQVSILQILYGVVSSPHASDQAASYIRNGNGIVLILPFLDHMEADLRLHALKLTSLLSEKLGHVLLEALKATNKLLLLKEKLLDADCSHDEKSEIAGILANLPISDDELRTVFGTDILEWALQSLKESPPSSSSSGKNAKHTRNMLESALGLLLHYAKSEHFQILKLVKENHFMSIFRNHIRNHFHDGAKKRAAMGLKYLSEASNMVIASWNQEPQLPHMLCIPFGLMCGSAPEQPLLCPLHNAPCKEDTSFCLLKGNAIKPLIELMNDANTEVQIAAVEALSTVMMDPQSLIEAAQELGQLGLFDAAVQLLKNVRPGDLQERVLYMLEKFLRVQVLVQGYATDQGLARALVEALKHGSPRGKLHAQEALTYLRHLSGVGARSANNYRGRRFNR